MKSFIYFLWYAALVVGLFLLIAGLFTYRGWDIVEGLVLLFIVRVTYNHIEN